MRRDPIWPLLTGERNDAWNVSPCWRGNRWRVGRERRQGLEGAGECLPARKIPQNRGAGGAGGGTANSRIKPIQEPQANSRLPAQQPKSTANSK